MMASPVVASIAIVDAALSPPSVDTIAGRGAPGLGRLAATEQTTQAELARRSEELKSAVLDALAHEIRNPLHSIRIAAATLLSGRISNDLCRREMLSVIEEEVLRIDRFLDETIHWAELGANELTVRQKPEDLAQLISAVVQEMRASIDPRPFQLRIPASLPAAVCDRRLISQVLKQLLNNALKYSPDDSPLIVSAAHADGTIVIDVTDRGPGIGQDEREKIFAKYYRGRDVRGRVKGGGLGLPSARCIVEAHGGRIWVTDGAGGGAAFHISLPSAGASQSAEQPNAVHKSVGS